MKEKKRRRPRNTPLGDLRRVHPRALILPGDLPADRGELGRVDYGYMQSTRPDSPLGNTPPRCN